ncbi:MAG: hypothetical protein WAL04_18145, partial [Acidimicrobiales bacterium]
MILGGSAVVVVAIVVAIATIGNGSSSGPKTSASTTTTTKRPAAVPAPNPAHSTTSLGPNGLVASWVVAENKLPGTTDWKIRDQPQTGSIDGFASVPYAAVGNRVVLY